MLSLSRLSLGTRLTLLAVATLSPIVAITVMSYFEDRDERRESALRETARYAESLASGLEYFARDLESFTQAASLALASTGRPIDNSNAQPFLAALAQQNDLIQYIFVTDLEGRVIAQGSGDDTGIDLSQRPYIRALKSGAESTWSGALDGLRSGTLTVAYARVIRDPAGEPMAYLVAAFYSARLAERFPATLPAGDDHLILVDQNAQLVYSSRDLGDASSDLSASSRVSTALAGQRVVFDGRVTLVDDDERFGSFVPIPSMNWALGYTRSQSQLESSLAASLQRDLFFLAAIGALSVLAFVLVSKQVTRPLRALSGAVTDMKDSAPVQDLRLTTEPDIARLQQAFLEMKDAVEAREAELADQTRVLDTLDQVGASLASSLDLDRTVQAVTDAGTSLTEAEFGAFFYNVLGDDGEMYQLYALSGADKSQFDAFGMPRNTALFGPTFRGEGILRIADVTRDERYGSSAPHFGMPPGHLPVRSYMALPVVAANNRVLGGLFFGHREPDRFTERHEHLAHGIAAWAAIAFDNARLYREAKLVQEQLLAANRTKDEFLSLVSHELRTPITVVALGAAHLLRTIGKLDRDEQIAVINDVATNAARLSELVQNLLVLARPDIVADQDLEPTLVRTVLQSVGEQFRERRPDRPLILAAEGADDAVAMGSRLYLEHVVMNLLSNADKYSPAGQPISIVVRTFDATVAISVRDRGPGLDDADLDHLFEPYYRGEYAKQQAGGFGLGLAVCRRLAEAMRGELIYEPGEGHGACFTLKLPLAALETPEDEAGAAARATTPR